jgi:hypothetical protein
MLGVASDGGGGFGERDIGTLTKKYFSSKSDYGDYSNFSVDHFSKIP